MMIVIFVIVMIQLQKLSNVRAMTDLWVKPTRIILAVNFGLYAPSTEFDPKTTSISRQKIPYQQQH